MYKENTDKLRVKNRLGRKGTNDMFAEEMYKGDTRSILSGCTYPM